MVPRRIVPRRGILARLNTCSAGERGSIKIMRWGTFDFIAVFHPSNLMNSQKVLQSANVRIPQRWTSNDLVGNLVRDHLVFFLLTMHYEYHSQCTAKKKTQSEHATI